MSTFKAVADYFNTSLKYRREVACFLNDDMRMLSLSTSNNPSLVKFDWDNIWPQIRDAKHRPHEVFMIHTHPPGVNRMSPMDRNMVYGWVRALGLPIRYSIICESEYRHYYCSKVDGKITTEDRGSDYDHTGLGDYHGELLKMVLEGLSYAENDFEDRSVFNTIRTEINSVFCPVVGPFEMFLQEVRLTYGNAIAERCRLKLDSHLFGDIDLFVVLAEAKKEVGFDSEKCMPAIHFVT